MCSIALLIFSPLSRLPHFVHSLLHTCKKTRCGDHMRGHQSHSVTLVLFRPCCFAEHSCDSLGRSKYKKMTCWVNLSPQFWQFPVVRCINRGYGADGVHGAKGSGNIWSPVGICPPASASLLNVSPTTSHSDIYTYASFFFYCRPLSTDDSNPQMMLIMRHVENS